MPSVNSSSIPKVCDSSTVMTPSLPTLSIASAMVLPISASCAEMAATEAISSLVSRSRAWSRMYSATASTARSMPRLSPSGLAPAATLRSPWRTTATVLAQALVHEGLRNVAAGDVVGLGRDFLGELGPEVLVVVLELDLLGDRHTIVGDGGRAPLLVEHDVATLGAECHPHHIGELVDARLQRAPRLGVEQQLLWHWVSPDLLVDDGEHVAGGEDQVVLAAVLDLGAAVLGVDDGVADLDVERHPGAVLEPARADRDDLALLGLLLGGVRDDDARGGRLLALTGLDDDAVLERLQIDAHRFLLYL